MLKTLSIIWLGPRQLGITVWNTSRSLAITGRLKRRIVGSKDPVMIPAPTKCLFGWFSRSGSKNDRDDRGSVFNQPFLAFLFPTSLKAVMTRPSVRRLWLMERRLGPERRSSFERWSPGTEGPCSRSSS